MDPIPWTKHPNPATSIKRGKPAGNSTSKIPLSSSSSRNDFDDSHSVNHPSNHVQDRAKNIILGQMKIVENSGKLRVARNRQLVDVQMPTTATDEDMERGKENIKSLESQSLPTEEPAEKSKSVTFSTTLPKSSDPQSIFSFTTALQRSSYEFKPPAAAKYFLWDNTRIGPTVFSSASDFTYSQVKITSPSMKSLRMEILKAGLLSRANSVISPPSTIGILMGKPSWNAETSTRELELDRFEVGENATGAMADDVLINCAWSETSAKEGFNYIVLLEKLKKQRLENPLSGLTTPFPIFAHFSTLEGGEITNPSFRMVIPNYSLEIYPIHEIRLVNTTLSYKLLSETSQMQPDYGLMSIDQARQLYLLPPPSTSIEAIPLIGVWIKSDLKTFRDGLLRKACMKYIFNQKISKLDTGKSHLLVYFFNTNNPSRPECFECVFSHDTERPFTLYGTRSNKPFELMSEDEPGFEFALNQVFGIPMKIPEVDVLDNADSIAVPEQQSEIEPPLVIPALEEKAFEPEEKAMQVEPILVTAPEQSTQAIDTTNVPLVESTMPPSPPSVSKDVISQQMLYINMLQQQISSLQAQMLSFTSGPYIGAPPGYAHHYWMHQPPQQPPHTHQLPQTHQPPYHQQLPEPSQAITPKVVASLKSESEHVTHVASDTKSKESFSNQVEMTKEEECKGTMQDEQVQVTFIMPQSQSIGTNTSFYFPPSSTTPLHHKLSSDQSISITEIKDELETLPLLKISAERTHAPTDDGCNYQVFDPTDSERPEQPPLPDTSACDIIAGLVCDVEESFYHTGAEEGESTHTINILKPKVKVPFKQRPIIAAEMQRKSFLVDVDESNRDITRDSSMLRYADQTMETEDQSISFATLKYLEKYGLQ